MLKLLGYSYTEDLSNNKNIYRDLYLIPDIICLCLLHLIQKCLKDKLGITAWSLWRTLYWQHAFWLHCWPWRLFMFRVIAVLIFILLTGSHHQSDEPLQILVTLQLKFMFFIAKSNLSFHFMNFIEYKFSKSQYILMLFSELSEYCL